MMSMMTDNDGATALQRYSKRDPQKRSLVERYGETNLARVTLWLRLKEIVTELANGTRLWADEHVTINQAYKNNKTKS